MRDLGSKMAELKFEAPLANLDETDDWAGCDFISNSNSLNDAINLNLKDPLVDHENKMRLLEEAVRDVHVSKNGPPLSPNCNSYLTTTDMMYESYNKEKRDNKDVMTMTTTTTTATTTTTMDHVNNPTTFTTSNSNEAFDNFTETFGGSLEDLVNTFDEKITKCFGNYEENVETLAPVQVRSQEEIMNECQMWWTITGNFGNILPIDWSKSYARKLHMSTLNLDENGPKKENVIQTPGDEMTSEDEAIANDLDMHSLILNGLNNEQEPIKSVEEVIKEIEYIIDEAENPDNDDNIICESEIMEKAKEVLGAPLYADKLQYLTITQLNELYMEMELLIQELSETLINELALRDELEFEKELKNTFISLLLGVQNKRRQYHVEKKRGKYQGADPKYLTTVIPYHMENGTPNNENLQVLIKILKAINEDSPTVPTLLTDYILKILCPT